MVKKPRDFLRDLRERRERLREPGLERNPELRGRRWPSLSCRHSHECGKTKEERGRWQKVDGRLDKGERGLVASATRAVSLQSRCHVFLVSKDRNCVPRG